MNSASFGLLLTSYAENEHVKSFFNPMEKMHKKGMNTLAYRDGLNLFDQIILSNNLLKEAKNQSGFIFFRAGIYNPSYLITQGGKYKGYPLRTHAGGVYKNGYSDHFPVYLYLIKEY